MYQFNTGVDPIDLTPFLSLLFHSVNINERNCNGIERNPEMLDILVFRDESPPKGTFHSVRHGFKTVPESGA